MNVTMEQCDELLAEFVDESIVALRELPGQTAEYGRNPLDSAPIDAVFRAVHSIKGNAGFFGLPSVKKFAHSLVGQRHLGP